MKGVYLTVVSRPETVDWECPECYTEMKIEYHDFIDLYTDGDYPNSCEGNIIKCDVCEKEFEIADLDWS